MESVDTSCNGTQKLTLIEYTSSGSQGNHYFYARVPMSSYPKMGLPNWET